jgi:hypothetical protein
MPVAYSVTYGVSSVIGPESCRVEGVITGCPFARSRRVVSIALPVKVKIRRTEYPQLSNSEGGPATAKPHRTAFKLKGIAFRTEPHYGTPSFEPRIFFGFVTVASHKLKPL